MTLRRRDMDWYAYVALPPDCRCVSAVIVDDPEHRRDVARFVASKIRAGLVVERMRGDAFRAGPLHCEAHSAGRRAMSGEG